MVMLYCLFRDSVLQTTRDLPDTSQSAIVPRFPGFHFSPHLLRIRARS